MKSRALILIPFVLVVACTKPGGSPTSQQSDVSPGLDAALAPTGKSGSSAAVTPPVMTGEALFGPGGIAPMFRAPEDVLWTTEGYVRIVPIHHATVLFEFYRDAHAHGAEEGKAYYVDPFREGNFDGLPKADFIFITHAHPDHFDLATLEKIRQPSTVIVAPPSVAEKLPQSFVGTVVMKNGDKRTVGNIGVEAVPMYNLTRGPSAGKLFHEKGWGDGFVLTFGDKRIYLSGDTECTPEMRGLENIDVAFVCMNLPYTMPPSEAAECIKAFKPRIVYPYHYRGSDLGDLDKGLTGQSGIEVRKREWY